MVHPACIGLQTRQNGRMSNGAETGSWSYTARTDIGRVREGNEDSLAAEPGLWIVADGLGGHSGGEIASATAVATARRVVADAVPDADPVEVLGDLFARAHAAVRQEGLGTFGMSGMGTTLVVALAGPDGTIQVGSIGDSRAYLLRDGRLRQLVRDDNYAEELLAAGVITATEARVHPGQYMLTRALIADQREPGTPQVARVDGPGRLLLCSDGLNSELEDEEIARLLGLPSLDEAADALVAAALEAGGRDNVTVVIVDL